MSLTAVLFAGGESRRMGIDKATLDWNGELLWSRQIRVLRELRPDELWISARARPAWCPAEIEVILDEPPSRGPLSGLVAALKRLRTTHLLVLAIDMPHMTVGHLEKLQAELRSGYGVIPKSHRGFEPLCAFYPAEAIDTAEKLLTTDKLSLQILAQTLIAKPLATIYYVSASESSLYWNVNTPGDYHETVG